MMEENKPLISVVLPVYNVERYLKRCVDSLLGQTYPNLELVLVDDGSPGVCPAMCDGFAAADGRITALHKENGGLSDARNYGVQHSRGDWVVFVDSDDYVDPDYVQQLWAARQAAGAQAAICGYVEETEDGRLISRCEAGEAASLTNVEAIEKVLYGREACIMAWGKLFPRQVLLDHPFPKGRIHEDLWTTWLLLEDCPAVALGKGSAYHYVRHEGSILGTTFHEGHYNAIDASAEMLRELEERHPELTAAAVARLAKEVIATVYRASRTEKYPEACRRAKAALKGRWGTAFCRTKLPVSLKAKLLLFKLHPGLFRTLYLLAKRNGG